MEYCRIYKQFSHVTTVYYERNVNFFVIPRFDKRIRYIDICPLGHQKLKGAIASYFSYSTTIPSYFSYTTTTQIFKFR